MAIRKRSLVLCVPLALVLIVQNIKVLQLQPQIHSHDEMSSPEGCQNLTCWAVVAPDDHSWASVAVQRQVKLKHWRLVIVFLQEPSEHYDPRWYPGEDGNSAVIYLTPDSVPGYLRRFCNLLEWSSVSGRKNIGYLYAISQGATIIWDFDDDIMLKFWIPGASPLGAPSLEHMISEMEASDKIEVVEPLEHKWLTYNPYPALGAPDSPSWPRGLPIEDALNINSSNPVTVEAGRIKTNTIAVLQSASDHQPDADELYSGIMPFPFYFCKPDFQLPLVVPKQTFTPYNKQASLHFQVALWALYLPMSVEIEISDVWRSYIAQRLFWEADLRVGFFPRPVVVKDHDIRVEENAQDTAKKASSKIKRLITFLQSWVPTGEQSQSVDGIVNELWEELAKHNFINNRDVKLVNLWMQALSDSGYSFPELSRNISKQTTQKHFKIDSHIAIPPPDEKNVGTRYRVKRNAPEYSSDQCKLDSTMDQLTIWTSDMHFATRLDQPSVLVSIGQNVTLAVGHLENRHPGVYKMNGMHMYNRVSNVIKSHFASTQDMNERVTEKLIRENYEFYKKDPEIASADAFMCLFQPGMCELWMPFNKTIIFIPAHRYNMGRCTITETIRLNEHLNMLASMESPKHVISASSKYDLEYLRHYTGLQVLPLYSFSGYYTAKYKYNPTRDDIPVFARTVGTDNWDERFITAMKHIKVKKYATSSPTYTFDDLVKYRAIVYLPYAVMSYKITEFYSMGIPLFFPSMKYLHTYHSLGPDRPITSAFWCGEKLLDNQMVPHPSSIHPYSPNAQDSESEHYWIQMADFFEWPHITYFDDFKDLEHKLLTADFKKIHELMIKEVNRRRAELIKNWCKVFRNVTKGRKVPQDYDRALRDLYGIEQLQIQ